MSNQPATPHAVEWEAPQAPERVFIQWYGSGDPEVEDCGAIYEDEVTWCRDKINAHDLEYIRKDITDAELQRLRELVNTAAEWIQVSLEQDDLAMDGRQLLAQLEAAAKQKE